MQTDLASLLFKLSGSHLTFAKKYLESKNKSSETKSCIQAVILFQSAMEAVINEEVYNHPLLEEVKLEEFDLNKKYKSLSFKNKWSKSYEALQIKEDSYLKNYLNFYSKYRGPISHPKSRYQKLDKYKFKKVSEGLENGWYAAQLLFAILGKDMTSWDKFAKESGFFQKRNS